MAESKYLLSRKQKEATTTVPPTRPTIIVGALMITFALHYIPVRPV